jgi:hypothetical protein
MGCQRIDSFWLWIKCQNGSWIPCQTGPRIGAGQQRAQLRGPDRAWPDLQCLIYSAAMSQSTFPVWKPAEGEYLDALPEGWAISRFFGAVPDRKHTSSCSKVEVNFSNQLDAQIAADGVRRAR